MNEDLRNVSEYLVCCGAASSVANTVVNHSHFQTEFRYIQREIFTDSNVTKKDKLPSAIYVTLQKTIMHYSSLGLEAESAETNTPDHELLNSALANINALGQASINVLMSSLLPFSDKFAGPMAMSIPVLNAGASAVYSRCRDDIQQALDAVLDGSDIGSKEDIDEFKERFTDAYNKSALLGPPKKGLFNNNWKSNPAF
jgi:hypothetical protein